MYLVITNITKDRQQYQLAVLSDDFKVTQHVVTSEDAIVNASRTATCINFSVENGKIKEDCGVLDRLTQGSFSLVILREITKKTGVVVGYTVLNTKTMMIMDVSKDALVKQQAMRGDIPLLQNGIIRNGTVNSYPNKKFIREVRQTSKPTRKSEQQVSKPIEQINTTQQAVRPDFLKDENLSVNQRRMLVNGKKNGALVEYFADSRIPNDVMDFYCNSIFDKKLAEDCKPIFENPNLSLSQVEELYQCAALGIDYKDMCDGNSTPEAIELVRLDRSLDIWGSKTPMEVLDSELLEKCLRMANSTLLNK